MAQRYSESTKGVLYIERAYNTNFECERCVFLLPSKLRKTKVKFRSTNLHLPDEIERRSSIERSERYCNLCYCNKIGDKFHVILECKAINNLRNQF